ncbi:glucose-6-phosphate dehydrogenase [Candidatus Saccharibacteria bacterium]|nr:glucose-6-phosphate dehydrogenase [Candidatus Saccharibacteria bacterium]
MNDYRERALILVIFGITGDLAQRKLLPALYNLRRKHELPEQTRIIGVSRQQVSADEIYAPVVERLSGVGFDQSVLDNIKSSTEIVTMDLDSAPDYERLLGHLHDISKQLGPGVSRLYYLSIPAQAFASVVSHLGATNHNEPFHEDADRPRILVEKPFGYDTASAQVLLNVTKQNFGEEQTFRIDHYLAKETAQNILTFRFQNPLFQSLWNAHYIDSIRISAFETIGIEGRAGFYEHTGALRDFVQPHLLQLLALITMENPGQLDSRSIHRAKLRLLESVCTIEPSEVAAKTLRGQYASYRDEVANPNSTVETFARLNLAIDNEQWRGVNVVLETGKGLSERFTEVHVTFKAADASGNTNTLIFRLQPREGITVLLRAKQPGLQNDTEQVEMDFDYSRSFGATSEAYERVIIDAMRGDQSLFASADEVLASWQIVEHVLQQWTDHGEDLRFYPIGSRAEDIV